MSVQTLSIFLYSSLALHAWRV